MGKDRRWLSEAVHSKMNQQDVADSLDYGGGEEGNSHVPKNPGWNKDNSSHFVDSVVGRKKKLVVNLPRYNLTLR